MRACSRSGRKLRVVGDGPEYRSLRSLAGGSVEFCGRLSAEALRDAYAGCRALLMPGEEDFGITPVEAMASGKPVVALGRGGVLESVGHDCGVFYPDPTDEHLLAALQRFEDTEYSFSPEALQARAARFSLAAFEAGMRRVFSSPSNAVFATEHDGQGL